MNFVKGKVLTVVRSLNVMPGAPIRWLKTYSDYQKCTLSMTPAMLDAGLMFTRGNGTLEGLVGIQIEGIICAPTPEFEK